MRSFFKFFFAALLAIIAFCFIGVMIISGIAASGGEQETIIEDSSVLHLTFDNPIVDRAIESPFNFDPQTFKPIHQDGLNTILTQIHKAKVDSRIEGIFIDAQFVMAGLASMQEIRDALVDFKSDGKWICAYSDVYSQGAYYLASVADEIYVEPEGALDLRGLSSDITFLKGMLEKVGVEVQVIRPSNNKFKSAVEPFILDSMSAANEEQLTQILTSIWDHMASDISASRGISVEALNAAVNDLSSRNSAMATEAGLITGAKYRDEITAMLREKCGLTGDAELELVSLNGYKGSTVSAFTDHSKTYSKDKVAVIYAAGAIDMGDSTEDGIGSDGLSKQISEARKDSSIKAIVLRVNSPGGSALASDVIWREMTLAKKSKPVIVSMGDVAASGGYYIACNADKIYASESTITGSIGVFGMIPNTQGLQEDILGVQHDGVKTHRYGDMTSIHRGMRPDEQAVWQSMVDHIYDDFTGKVAEGRGKDQEYINSIGQGRVWSGVDALDNGLIDVYGGLEEAIADAAAMAGLEKYNIKSLPEELDPIEQIMKELMGQTTRADILSEISEGDLALFQMMKRYHEVMEMQGVQMRMPFVLDIAQ